MESRTRERVRYFTNGYVVNDDVEYHGDPDPIYRKICKDYYDKGRRGDGIIPPSDLYLYTFDARPSTIVGYRSDVPNHQPAYHNWNVVLGDWDNDPHMGWIRPFGEPEDGELVAKLLGSTNPFRPTVSVPVMISELVEGVSLLKIATQSFWTMVGSGWLNDTFGWGSLMLDIRRLSNITTHIEKRIKEFNGLLEDGGLPKRLKKEVFTFPDRVFDDVSFDSRFSFSVKGGCRISYKSTVWASCRWKPARDKTIPVERLEQFNLAVRQILDLEAPDPATVWEAIPFSWLVDYFFSIGPALQAIEDEDKVKPYDVCVMRKREIKYRYSNNAAFNTRGVSVKPGSLSVTVLNRRVMRDPELTDLIRFGFMSEAQALNLIALLLSRKKNGPRI